MIKENYPHYFKNVSDIQYVDVYKVCELFEIDDPSGCIQHAIKKLLVAGKRGNKDYYKDLSEAVVSIQRKLEIMDGTD